MTVREARTVDPCGATVSNHCTGTNRESVKIDRPVFADRPADTRNSSDLERIRLHVEGTVRTVSIVGVRGPIWLQKVCEVEALK
mgnify:CR=1 FL=1